MNRRMVEWMIDWYRRIVAVQWQNRRVIESLNGRLVEYGIVDIVSRVQLLNR